MSIRRQLGDLAKSLDSSAVGSFLSKGASKANFTTISYSDVSGTPSGADSAVATSIIDSAYVQARVTGAGTGLDSATTINLLDSNYMAARSGGGAGFFVYNYDATAGQTTFQDSDAAGNVMSYSADGIIVFYNGVMLPTADYTATDGTSVVLDSAADSQDVVTIAKWSVGSSAGGGSSFDWGGDRGLFAGGLTNSTISNQIQYISISSPGNTTDFGDLTRERYFMSGGCSDITYGLFGGGTSNTESYENIIDYVTIATTSNASDFGDLTVGRYSPAACSNGIYGVWGGGRSSIGYENTIDYITIASPSNATDFGDMTFSARYGSSCADNTYGIFAGGLTSGGQVNTMDYVTIASPSNASDFGDLTSAKYYVSATSDITYGLIIGGFATAVVDDIEYITISTPANAVDFGNLTIPLRAQAASSDGTYGVAGGGIKTDGFPVNSIDYVTIATPSNASDFGDLTAVRYGMGSCSGSAS